MIACLVAWSVVQLPCDHPPTQPALPARTPHPHTPPTHTTCTHARASHPHTKSTPQLLRWLEFFTPSQLLLVSFNGYVKNPSEVIRDVLSHAGLSLAVATAASEQASAKPPRKQMQNSRARGKGRMPPKLWGQLCDLYMPFLDRLYAVIESRKIVISPCSERGALACKR